jgi:hypothetical protein
MNSGASLKLPCAGDMHQETKCLKRGESVGRAQSRYCEPLRARKTYPRSSFHHEGQMLPVAHEERWRTTHYRSPKANSQSLLFYYALWHEQPQLSL